jgi:hypothetical protein
MNEQLAALISRATDLVIKGEAIMADHLALGRPTTDAWVEFANASAEVRDCLVELSKFAQGTSASG